jgi:hypothetical protein
VHVPWWGWLIVGWSGLFVGTAVGAAATAARFPGPDPDAAQ